MATILRWVRRHGLRVVAVVVFALLALGLASESWRAAGAAALPRLSPLLNLFGALAAREWVGWTIVLGVPLLVVPFFWGRVFCWRLCPMGFLAELAGKLNPWGKGWVQCVPALNEVFALFIVVTAAFGYPLFLWLDPLCIFNGFFVAWRAPLTVASASIGTMFVVVMVLAVVVPNVWCHKLCPLGGLQQAVMEFARWLRRPKNTGAWNEGGPQVLTAASTSRRSFLGNVGISIGTSITLGGVGLALKGAKGGARALRPPSADVERITALCARCGNCMKACPYELIHPDLGETGFDGFLSPVIHFRSKIPNWDPDEDRYCFQDCVKCTQVCPTGALRPITVEQKHAMPIGRAEVLKDKCLAWAKGEYCAVCDEYCPYKAVKLKERNGVNCPIIDPDKCRGCGACEGACPGDPVAIIVRPLQGH